MTCPPCADRPAARGGGPDPIYKVMVDDPSEGRPKILVATRDRDLAEGSARVTRDEYRRRYGDRRAREMVWLEAAGG